MSLNASLHENYGDVIMNASYIESQSEAANQDKKNECSNCADGESKIENVKSKKFKSQIMKKSSFGKSETPSKQEQSQDRKDYDQKK